ncbi:MAG: sugar isomerase domain-containing protein [Spirochaetia bacterium]
MKKYKEYLDHVIKLQQESVSKQEEKIQKIAQMFVETTLSGGSLWVFGATHSGMVSEELMYRAGGCALFNGIFDPHMLLNYYPADMTSKYEQAEGSGTLLFQAYPIKAGDAVLIYSVSGRNSVGIELALESKKIGAKVIGLTSYEYTSGVKSRHSSGKKLIDIADLTLDCYCEIGDACMKFEGVEPKVAPTSTLTSITLVNCILLEYVSQILEKGEDAPVLQSGNRDGGMDWNEKIFKKYASQIHYL